jgi:hypothetical protein
MKTYQIIVKDGKGRPVNPYQRLIPRSDKYPNENIVNPDWTMFQENEPWLSTDNIPDTSIGEPIMAYLQWQYNKNNGTPNGKWVNIPTTDKVSYYKDIPTRQIWVATPESKQVESKFGEWVSKIRTKAIEVIVKQMGDLDYMHFPLRKVAYLKSFVSNPVTSNYATKGNLELWSTDSLCELADYINSLPSPPNTVKKGE